MLLKLPMDMVLTICMHLPKPDLMNVTVCCKALYEKRDVLILMWIKHTLHVGVLFKLDSICRGILESRNMHLVNEMFIHAAFIGRTDVVRLCLGAGADVDFNGDALVVAARFNYLEILEMLLESGADVHVRQDEALMCSIAKGNRDASDLLTKHGATNMFAAAERGLQLRRQMRHKAIQDIQPWLHNAAPPARTERTTVGALVKLISLSLPQRVR